MGFCANFFSLVLSYLYFLIDLYIVLNTNIAKVVIIPTSGDIVWRNKPNTVPANRLGRQILAKLKSIRDFPVFGFLFHKITIKLASDPPNTRTNDILIEVLESYLKNISNNGTISIPPPSPLALANPTNSKINKQPIISRDVGGIILLC